MQTKQIESANRFRTGSLWQYSLSFLADIASVQEHYHYCYKVVVTLDNTFDCIIDGKARVGLRGFVVNKTVPHACFAVDSHVLVSLIEPNSMLAWKLRDLLDGKSWIDLGTVFTTEQLTNILPPNYNGMTNADLIPYVNKFFDSLMISYNPMETDIDKRVKAALRYVEDNLSGNIELESVADKMNLSLNRARHLFVEEMGIPFTQYVLWQRIRKTMSAAIIEESRLTEACLRFGFVDQPHFNKIFKRIFGLPPQSIIKYCRVLL